MSRKVMRKVTLECDIYKMVQGGHVGMWASTATELKIGKEVLMCRFPRQYQMSTTHEWTCSPMGDLLRRAELAGVGSSMLRSIVLVNGRNRR